MTTMLMLLLSCALSADPVEVPVSETPASESKALPTPADAQILGLELRSKKSEKSRDSHTLTTTVRLEDRELSVSYAATGRASGREKPSRRVTLTPEQLGEVEQRVRDAGLLEPRTVNGISGSRFTRFDVSASVWMAGGAPVRTVVVGDRGEGSDTVRTDEAYRAVNRIVAFLERLE